MFFGTWTILGALIGVLAAQVRGFNLLAGIVVGALLGPFAFLMFFASGVTREDASRVHCPHCDEKISPRATVCPHCQRDVARAAAEGSANAAAEEPRKSSTTQAFKAKDA